MAFPGLQHVAITVSDLDASTQWYTRLFGADPVLDEDEEGGEFHHVVYALDGGLLFGLHTHHGPGGQGPRRRAPYRPRPHQLRPVGHLRAREVARPPRRAGDQHGGIKKAHYGSGVSFRDPDNIALEFFIAPGT